VFGENAGQIRVQTEAHIDNCRRRTDFCLRRQASPVEKTALHFEI
jgi:hypothetical protein